jgi:hypothetical protein
MADIINDFYRMAFEKAVADARARRERDGHAPLPDYDERKYVVVDRCEFNDGYHISIQAGHGKYSTPRISDYPEYMAFELGFPSAPDDLIQGHAEDPARPTETVYGYVSTETVVALAEKHGGIKGIYVYPEEAAANALSAALAPAKQEG